MKRAYSLFARGVVLVTALAGTFYLLLPTPVMPPPPANSLQSNEPADVESPYRYAFFSNLTRQEIMAYYKNQFSTVTLLNHPPEDSYTLIRDQTRSSWLEELVNPGKNSLYINGYYPTKPTEQINRNGQHYSAKITVRYSPSNKITQFTALSLICVATYFLLEQFIHA